ncbi:MAG: nitrilase-related carbon-nitrogen hydrolase [Spirochaetota bacterium]
MESSEAFAQAVRRRFRRACSQRSVRLLVFPELSGLWLQLSAVLGRSSVVNSKPAGFAELAGLAAGRLVREPGALLRGLFGGGGRALTANRWKQHLQEWLEPFCRGAEEHNVYVCPGSTFLPRFHYSPRGNPVMDKPGPANTSCLIAPNGKLLGFRSKVRLTSLEKRLGLIAGDVAEDLLPYRTELGKVGLAVCLDGFYEDIIARLDMQGTEYVLQPSANSIDWNSLLQREDNRQVRQSEEWLSCGSGALIQGRERIIAAYNPMCVTRGLLFSNSGKSSAWINCRRAATQAATTATTAEVATYPGLIKQAHNEYQEEILYVELPEP